MKQAIAVLLAVVVGVGIAYLVVSGLGLGMPPEQRATQRLTSPHADVRAEAIARWSEPTGQSQTPALFADFKLMETLRPALREAPDAAVRDLGDAFSEHPQWPEQFPDANERYLLLLAADPDVADAAGALRGLRRIDDLSRIAGVLEVLADHPDAAIRLSALEHASHYLGATAEPIITELLDDESPTVARAAWLAVAIFKPSTGLTARWREAPTPVRDAMLYAIARVSPGEIDRLLAEIEDDSFYRSTYGDVPFLLRYIADGNDLLTYLPGPDMDEQLKDLVRDAKRARGLHSGQRPDLLTIPGEESETP